MKIFWLFIKSLFKCIHLTDDVVSGTENKIKLISEDTDYEVWNCECTCKCGETVMKDFAFFKGGVEGFLSRGSK